MIATVVGKKDQQYKQKSTGELKHARELHVVKEAPAHAKDGFVGVEVAAIWCPFDISDIEIGKQYDFIYEIRSGRNGDYAALVDIVPIGK